MADRTAVSLDGGPTVLLKSLPDTGGWGTFKWSRSAEIDVLAGKHVLRWQNLKGGGLNLEAFIISDEPGFAPTGTSFPPVAEGRHRLLIQAENFVRYGGKQLQVGGSGAGERDRFYYKEGDFRPEWAQAPEALVHIYQTSNCRAFKEIAGIAGVDPVERVVKLNGPELSSSLQSGDRYFVDNLEDECDAPGEWYLSRRTGTLTIVPPPGFSAKTEVMAPTVGRLVEIIGEDDKDKAVTGLVFRGLTFRGGDWSQQDGCGGYGMGTNGVLYLKNAVGCTIADCRFTNLGKDAVCAEGGGGHTIRNNDITDSAEGGININGAIGNRIVGNHIHHCGQVYKHNGAVTLQNGAAGNLVSGNMIHDMTRYGITMKLAGHDNVIEYNRVLNTSLETYDTGAIEVTQQDREDRSGTKIRYNIVGDCVGYSSSDGLPYFLSWGIYLDSFAGGYEVTNNLVYRNNNGGIMFQGGKDNRVTNNIFVDGRVGQGSHQQLRRQPARLRPRAQRGLFRLPRRRPLRDGQDRRQGHYGRQQRLLVQWGDGSGSGLAQAARGVAAARPGRALGGGRPAVRGRGARQLPATAGLTGLQARLRADRHQQDRAALPLPDRPSGTGAV